MKISTYEAAIKIGGWRDAWQKCAYDYDKDSWCYACLEMQTLFKWMDGNVYTGLGDYYVSVTHKKWQTVVDFCGKSQVLRRFIITESEMNSHIQKGFV